MNAISQTTVLLVHAAWADASSWHKVIVPLQQHGFKVVAVQIPLTSLTDDIKTVQRELARVETPVILAGHSYGGAVVSAAAYGEPKVKALVIIAGMAPARGETIGALLQRDPHDPLRVGPIAGDDGFLRLPEGAFAQAAAPNAPPEEAVVMQAVQRPLAIACITEPMPEPADLPSWFLIAEHDRMIPPATQRFMAERMKATVRSLPIDHTPMASSPQVVVNLIVEASSAL